MQKTQVTKITFHQKYNINLLSFPSNNVTLNSIDYKLIELKKRDRTIKK